MWPIRRKLLGLEYGSVTKGAWGLLENPSSAPSAHIWQSTTTCNFSFQGSDGFFWPPQVPTLTCTY